MGGRRRERSKCLSAYLRTDREVGMGENEGGRKDGWRKAERKGEKMEKEVEVMEEET